MEEYIVNRKMFGKEIKIAVHDIEPMLAEGVVSAAYAEGLRLQKIFNFYDSESELSLLNKRRKLEVSAELLEVLQKSLEYCRMTDGEYDISLGEVIRSRKEGRPEPEVSYSYRDIRIQENLVNLEQQGMLVDLGSIAKGYIVDRIVHCLQSQGVLSGIVDGRGDIRVFGDNGCIIGVQHPREPDKHIRTIRLTDMAVATSGDYSQYKGDFEHSHIVRKKDLISVTVIAKDLMDADAFATALSVCSIKKRKSLLDAHKTIIAMTVDRELKVDYHNGFEDLIVK